MSEKERVLAMLRQLPDDVSTKEIVRHFEAMTGINMSDVRMHSDDAVFADSERELAGE